MRPIDRPFEEAVLPVVACLFDATSVLTFASISLAFCVNCCCHFTPMGFLGGSFRKGSMLFRLKLFMMWSCKAAELMAD